MDAVYDEATETRLNDIQREYFRFLDDDVSFSFPQRVFELVTPINRAA